MASLNIKIRNKVRGDDIPIIRRYVDLPANDNVVKARLTVKSNITTPDPGIFQITIVTVSQPFGIITDGTPPEIYLTFLITKSQSLMLTAGTLYYYDIQVETSSGLTYTCEKGNIKLEEQITQVSG